MNWSNFGITTLSIIVIDYYKQMDSLVEGKRERKREKEKWKLRLWTFFGDQVKDFVSACDRIYLTNERYYRIDIYAYMHNFGGVLISLNRFQRFLWDLNWIFLWYLGTFFSIFNDFYGYLWIEFFMIFFWWFLMVFFLLKSNFGFEIFIFMLVYFKSSQSREFY